ncbi:5-formyltetrahydrofolate cyclo-ligase [Hydrogenimonas sp. SS33]|uniref:5-formyltetrahydrofolate cyclo-ligase n=1 Tax=Hydrogenimonas leucolamina TaxID=2954236 RepID=UPI00336BF8BD
MDKAAFRKICLARLKRAERTGRWYRNRAVLRKLEKIIKKTNPKSILLYMPMGHEVDVWPLFRHLRRRHRLFVPFMEGESFKLVQYRLPLFKKQYGIYEPSNSRFYLTNIDMAVVPVVGVDGRFRRIGFGKGMYDRFFGSLKHKPVTLFVQLTACCTKERITDDYDVEADIYITPEMTLFRGKRHDYGNYRRRCGSRY